MAKYRYDKKRNIYRTPSGQRMTTEMVLSVLNGKWGRSLRKITVDGPTVLTVKRPKQLSQEDWSHSLRELAQDVVDYLGVSVVMVGVEQHGDINKLGVEQFAKMGFMPIEDCYMSNKEADKYIAVYTGEEE